MVKRRPGAQRDGVGPRQWTGLADVLLQRTALVARVQRERPPDALAGLKVDDADVVALLTELPGLDGPAGSAEIEAELARQVDAVRRSFADLTGDPDRFGALAVAAQLTALEREVLAVLCAVEIDPRRQRLVGYINDDVTLRRLTPWSLRQLFEPDDDVVGAVGPGGGLRRAALLAPPADGPWASCPIEVDSSAVWWLMGDGSGDPDLPFGTESMTASGTGRDRLVVAAGPDRRRRLEAVAERLEASGLLISPLPTTRAQWDALVRQATLRACGVVLEVSEQLGPEGRERIERADHLAWAVTSTVELALDDLPRRPWSEVAVAPGRATSEEWAAAFGPTTPVAYALSAEQLHQVGRAARALDGDLAAAVRRLATGHIEQTATRIRPTRSWSDIVLDDQRLGQLREITIRSRRATTVFGDWGFSPLPSTGVVALFAGPSGTGKTLAAEIIAAELGVDLYKIDLANLVSKYIGETEKNLARLFDGAEAANVALFLDEADALMGKRSEVSDAHDRYANIEVAYLLQRLERYEGLAIMATNLAKNLDPAFLRRLHVVVEFPMPGPDERLRIWAASLPSLAPRTDDLDLAALAKQFELSGGTIRNAVLGAAFVAAESGTAISMELAVASVGRELKKMGHLATADVFGPFSHLVGL